MNNCRYGSENISELNVIVLRVCLFLCCFFLSFFLSFIFYVLAACFSQNVSRPVFVKLSGSSSLPAVKE